MTALRFITALVLSTSLGATAAAQLRPEAPGDVPAELVRDGAGVWQVRRDGADPTRVTATAPTGGVLRGRVDEHALIRVAPGLDPRAVMRSLDVVPEREVSPTLRAWRVVDARGGDGLALAARLRGSAGPGRPLVDAIPDWIVPQRTRSITIPPNDSRYAGQWYLDRIHIEEAWQLSSGDASTTIVIVDSGCDGAHVDLAGHLDPGRDVIDMDDDPTPSSAPSDAHGTSCAGLAAAETDNGEGIAGTCPECRLRCVRLLSESVPAVAISADLEAFQFALDVDAAVVSNSWGFVEPTPIPDSLRAILETLVDDGRGGRGALVLFASGNDDRELFDYELEAVRGVITVGAVNNFDEATSYSNRGAAVDVVAPTGTLTTDVSGAGGTDPGDYTSAFGGTSSSCPVAAGVAGLLVSAVPDASGADLAAALVETARPSPFATPDADGHDLLYGYGRIDPPAALRRALGIPEPGPDAGAGEADAGAGEVDAGAAPPPSDEGCSCGAAGRGAPAPLPLLALVVLGAVRWRRG